MNDCLKYTFQCFLRSAWLTLEQLQGEAQVYGSVMFQVAASDADLFTIESVCTYMRDGETLTLTLSRGHAVVIIMFETRE